MNELDFSFTPRSPEELRKDIEEIITEYLEEDDIPNAKKEAHKIFKNLQKTINGNDLFIFFDALGLIDKDLELQYIYALSMQCWNCRAVPPDVKCNPDLEAEQILKYTLNKGFDKKMHSDFITKRESEN